MIARTDMTTFILPIPLPVSAVKVGTLTLNPRYPPSDLFDPCSQTSSNISSTTTSSIQTLDTSFSRKHTTSFRSVLTDYISNTFSIASNTSFNVTSLQCTEHILNNQREAFADVCQMEPAQRWMEKAISFGSSVYLITGYRTMLSPKVTASRNRTHSMEGEVSAPLETIVTAIAGVPIPPMGVDLGTNTGVGTTTTYIKGNDISYEGSGEVVFAIQVRKVRFSWFSSRDFDEARLESGSRWKVLWALRGAENQTDDILQADAFVIRAHGEHGLDAMGQDKDQSVGWPSDDDDSDDNESNDELTGRSYEDAGTEGEVVTFLD